MEEKRKLIAEMKKMGIKEVLGKNIRYYRYKHKYSQQTLAELLDISVSYMSDIECGKANVSLDLIQKIAFLFEVSFDELFKVRNDILPEKISMLEKPYK